METQAHGITYTAAAFDPQRFSDSPAPTETSLPTSAAIANFRRAGRLAALKAALAK